MNTSMTSKLMFILIKHVIGKPEVINWNDTYCTLKLNEYKVSVDDKLLKVNATWKTLVDSDSRQNILFAYAVRALYREVNYTRREEFENAIINNEVEYTTSTFYQNGKPIKVLDVP